MSQECYMDNAYEYESEFEYDPNEPETQESYMSLTQEDYNNVIEENEDYENLPLEELVKKFTILQSAEETKASLMKVLEKELKKEYPEKKDVQKARFIKIICDTLNPDYESYYSNYIGKFKSKRNLCASLQTEKEKLQLKIKAIKAKGDRFYKTLLNLVYPAETPKKQISNYYDKLPTKEAVYNPFFETHKMEIPFRMLIVGASGSGIVRK